MTFEDYRAQVAKRYAALPEHEKESIRRLAHSDDGKIMQRVLGDDLLGNVNFAKPADNRLDTKT